MKFSDDIIREKFEEVFIKRTESDFEKSDEYNSNVWEVEKYDISYDNTSKAYFNLYKVPARAVKIGEDIYSQDGTFVAYRSN